MDDKQSILFLCTGNSCRSQMAEGWAKSLGGDEWAVRSAGVETHGLNTFAVQVMAEAGIDISNHRSELIDQLDIKQFDYVITVCDNAAENCPIFPGKAKKIHNSFADPPKLAASLESEEEKLDCYRKVRDQIRRFVEEFFNKPPI